MSAKSFNAALLVRNTCRNAAISHDEDDDDEDDDDDDSLFHLSPDSAADLIN